MVVVICPKCNRVGSLNSFSKKGQDKKYWRVTHGSTDDRCYFGRNPEEKFTVVRDKKTVPIKTGREMQADDDTSV